MIHLIRVFLKVVEQGSFSKAGRILNMAPSSVTRTIDQLEKELEVTLLKRSTRQLVLTEEGNSFLDGATKLLIQADELTESLKLLDAEPEGSLNISILESFGRIHVSPFLPRFLSKYPKVKLDVALDNRMVDLVGENIDIAIRIGRPVDSGLKARKLMPNHTVVCASPGYIEQHGLPVSPDDLTSHNCLVLSNNRQKNYWHFRQSKKYKRVPVSGNLTSKGGTPILAALLGGVGIAQVSHWMVNDHLQDGRLAVCLQDWDSSLHEGSSGDVYAVYVNNSYLKPSIRVFIDLLVEDLDKTILPILE